MIELLDCTLRDGGYYTLWDFDTHLVDRYCYLMSKLPIKYIEIGYKSLETDAYFGEFYYTPIDTLRKVRGKLDKSQKISLMLNAKDCINTDLSLLLKNCEGLVDLVRIATDPEKIELSLQIAKTVKSLGYKVAINLMYLSKIDVDHDIYNTIADIDMYIDYLYLVDSYGAMYPNDLKKSIQLFRRKTNVKLGFHGHNNLELAFINSIIAIECGVEIIDSTVMGMGRGAGNLKLELLMIHLKSKKHLDVDLNSLSQLIEQFIPLMSRYEWGTNLPYMVSGSYSMPQKDVMDAIEIERYSVASLVNTMSSDTIKTLQTFQCDSKVSKVVVIGGGSSIDKHIKAITKYLKENKDIVIIHSTSKHIYKFRNLNNKQLFCVAGDELTKLSESSQFDFIDMFVFEPSPRKINVNIPLNDNLFELEKIDFVDHAHDSPLSISLQTALNLGSSIIELIGFDGYTELKSKKELYLMQENQIIITEFSRKLYEIISLTKTNYKNLIQKSIYSKGE